MLFLCGFGIERGKCQQRVGGRDGAARKALEQRCDGHRARGILPLARANRLAGLDAADGLVARYGLREGQANGLVQALVAGEEEALVRDDGAADRPSELVQRELLLLVVVPARGVQAVVAEVIEHRTAEPIAPALAYHRDVATCAETALGRSEAGVHTELRDRLHRRLQTELRSRGVEITRARVPHVSAVNAVVVQIVLLVRLAVEPDARPAAVAVGRGAGRERHQVGEVAAVDRQIGDFFRRHVDADFRRDGIDDRRFAHHGHRLGNRADTELNVERLHVRDPEPDLSRLLRESREIERHGVGAGVQVRHRVTTVSPADNGANRSRLL